MLRSDTFRCMVVAAKGEIESTQFETCGSSAAREVPVPSFPSPPQTPGTNRLTGSLGGSQQLASLIKTLDE